MEDVFHSLDLEYLNKLAKVLPQKLSGSSIIPKNPSDSFKNRLFNQFLKEKNLRYIFKYISSGYFHDIVANDENIYKGTSIQSMEVFFEEIKNKELESPFSFYIYLISFTKSSSINFPDSSARTRKCSFPLSASLIANKKTMFTG